MKITLITSAALVALLALSGCSEETSTAEPSPTAEETTTSIVAAVVEPVETLSVYYTLLGEKNLRKLVADAGLGSQIPAGTEDRWYRGAAANCDAVAAGQPAPLEGVWADLDNLSLKAYCPLLVP